MGFAADAVPVYWKGLRKTTQDKSECCSDRFANWAPTEFVGSVMSAFF